MDLNVILQFGLSLLFLIVPFINVAIARSLKFRIWSIFLVFLFSIFLWPYTTLFMLIIKADRSKKNIWYVCVWIWIGLFLIVGIQGVRTFQKRSSQARIRGESNYLLNKDSFEKNLQSSDDIILDSEN